MPSRSRSSVRFAVGIVPPSTVVAVGRGGSVSVPRRVSRGCSSSSASARCHVLCYISTAHGTANGSGCLPNRPRLLCRGCRACGAAVSLHAPRCLTLRESAKIGAREHLVFTRRRVTGDGEQRQRVHGDVAVPNDEVQ